MKRLSEVIGKELRVEKTSSHRRGSFLFWSADAYFHVYCAGDLVAILDWSHFNEKKIYVEASEGQWCFHLKGLFNQSIYIRRINPDKDIGVFKLGRWKGGGILKFLNGHEYYLVPLNFLESGYEWKTLKNSLVTIKHPFHILRITVLIEKFTTDEAELSLFFLLELHLYLFIHGAASEDATFVS